MCLRWCAVTAIPIRRVLYYESLIREEHRKRWADDLHTTLRWGLEHARVTLQNDLIERGLAHGKPSDPGGVFGSTDNMHVAYLLLTASGMRHNNLARRLWFIDWMNRRHVSKTCAEYIQCDKRIADRVNSIKHADATEQARMVNLAVTVERWESFFFQKNADLAPIAYILDGRPYVLYGGGRVDEVESVEEAHRIVNDKVKT